MRLFLSSENFGRHVEDLMRLVGKNKKVAYIADAKDGEDVRDMKVQEHKVQFEGLGFEFIELDLRNYLETKVSPDILEGFGLVWCSGGNTFLLNYAMHRSGFAKILQDAVQADKLAYGGSSAGSVVATPTLHGVEHGDNQEAVKELYGQEAIWDGLNFVPFYIAPHYKSDWFGKQSADMVNNFKKNNHDYYALEDGQVILVDGDKLELLP
jgi:peptidase E